MTHLNDALIVDVPDKKIKLEKYFQLFEDIKFNLLKHDSYDFYQRENNPFDPSRGPSQFFERSNWFRVYLSLTDMKNSSVGGVQAIRRTVLFLTS